VTAGEGPWSRAAVSVPAASAPVDPAPFAIGPVRHALDVPGIDMGTYVEMQELFLRPAGRRPRWRRWLTWLGFGLLGVLVGLLLSYTRVRASLSLGVEGIEPFLFGGRTTLLTLLGLIVATAILCVVGTSFRYAAILARLHSGASAVVGPQRLGFGEEALLVGNDRRTVRLSWPTLTDVRQGRTCLFLIFNGMEAVWLPHGLLAAMPDRAGLEAFLAERHGAPIPPPPQLSLPPL